MKFLLAIVVWLIMAAVIGSGVVMAAQGSVWLLVVSVLAFIVMVGKIGCATE